MTKSLVCFPGSYSPKVKMNFINLISLTEFKATVNSVVFLYDLSLL